MCIRDRIFFLDEDPRNAWEGLFASQQAWVEQRGLGRVTYAAPFIPTIPGTDRYTDELW